MVHYKREFYKLLLMMIDLVSIILSFFISIWIRSHLFADYGPIHGYIERLWLLGVALIIYPVLFWILNAYSVSMDEVGTFLIHGLKMTVGSILAVISLAALLYFTKYTEISRLYIVIFGVTTYIGLILARITLIGMISLRMQNKEKTRKVLLVGVSDKGEAFVRYITRYPQLMLEIIGYVNVHGDHQYAGIPRLGEIEDVTQIMGGRVVDEVVFALPQSYMSLAEKYVCECEKMGITVHMILDYGERTIAKTKIDHIGTMPVLTFHSVTLNECQLFFKRILDIAGAVVGLLVTGIVLLIVAPAIKLESPGPIFFSQNRVGKNGRLFKIYKLRSMYQDAEQRKKDLLAQNQMKGHMFKVDNDPRITKVGRFIRKTSIDELPQFWNVLKGDMSLVGTRPPTTDEVASYELHHRRRISIKPGLTGLWQVSGRSDITDFEEVVRLDTQYIDSWRLWLDIKIIFKTVGVVLWRKGSR